MEVRNELRGQEQSGISIQAPAVSQPATKSDIVTVYHHTLVAPKDFDFGNFQRGKNVVSQFGDGLNAASTTTPFFVNRYGNPIKGEVRDSEFVVIDANMSQKAMYEMLAAKGFKFNNPQMGKSTPEGASYVGGNAASEYDDTSPLKDSPGAAMDLFKDFQESNPQVKGVKVINHKIGNQEVDPFYVIYDAKSFYGPGSLSKSNVPTTTQPAATTPKVIDIVEQPVENSNADSLNDAESIMDDIIGEIEGTVKPGIKIQETPSGRVISGLTFATNQEAGIHKQYITDPNAPQEAQDLATICKGFKKQ